MVTLDSELTRATQVLREDFVDKVAHESSLHGRKRGISGRNRKKKSFSEGPRGGKTDAERTLLLWTLVAGTRGKRQGEGCVTGTLDGQLDLSSTTM